MDRTERRLILTEFDCFETTNRLRLVEGNSRVARSERDGNIISTS